MTRSSGITILRGGVRALGDAARGAEGAGYGTVWTPELYTRSAVVTLAHLAGRTSEVRLGTSIAYAVGRSPLTLATEARSLDELSGGRLILGLGTGTKRMMSDWHGVAPDGPAPRLEELVPLLRRLWRLHEGPVHHDGRFYHLDLVPTAEVDVPVRLKIPVYTAGVNPRMIQAAGRVADGFIGHPLFGPAYVEEVVRPQIAEGARRAGRNPAAVEVCGVVICSIADDEDQARREAAAQLAFYAAPRTYRSVLARSGFEAAADAVRERLGDRDLEATAAAVPSAMVDELAVAGTATEVAEQLARRRSVLDHVIVYPPSFGMSPERCEELAQSLATSRPLASGEPSTTGRDR